MKKIKFTLKRLCIVVLSGLLLLGMTKISAGYMYTSTGQLMWCSDGFTVTTDGIYGILSEAWKGMITESNKTAFNSPADMALFTDSNGIETIYIVDSGSNNLFIFDGDLKYQQTITQFEVSLRHFTSDELATIKTAQDGISTNLIADGVPESGKTYYVKCLELAGVYRSLRPAKNDDGTNMLDQDGNTIYQDILYLCDSKNRQILLLDVATYKIIQVVTMPSSVSFADKFQPTKIVTDTTGRMYVISTNIYEGILLISYQGNFMSMVGVNYTTLSFWDAIKRNFKTDQQLEQETAILQTSFTNLCIDNKNFLYTVSGPIKNADETYNTNSMIKKINQANVDVLKRTGYSVPKGDLIVARTGANAGSSNFVGITVNAYGIYTVIDNRNNRLFTYNDAGELLYISGGAGAQVTNISLPVAVMYKGDSLLVLDKGNKCVMRFEPTDFAKKINQAVYNESIGDNNKAAELWQEVINSNPQYELAYVGVGKKLYEEGRYQEAMLNFQKGADVKYYSRAYKMYRDTIIKKYFSTVVIGLFVIVCGSVTLKIVKKSKNKNPNEEGDIL